MTIDEPRATSHGTHLRASIRKCFYYEMESRELRRLRAANNLSQQKLADKMIRWLWTRFTVADYERAGTFKLDPPIMQDLLTALNVSSI